MLKLEQMIEQLLMDYVLRPLMKNPVVRGTIDSDHSLYDADTVVEARIWGMVRRIADQRISACQAQERKQREIRVA